MEAAYGVDLEPEIIVIGEIRVGVRNPSSETGRKESPASVRRMSSDPRQSLSGPPALRQDHRPEPQWERAWVGY